MIGRPYLCGWTLVSKWSKKKHNSRLPGSGTNWDRHKQIVLVVLPNVDFTNWWIIPHVGARCDATSVPIVCLVFLSSSKRLAGVLVKHSNYVTPVLPCMIRVELPALWSLFLKVIYTKVISYVLGFFSKHVNAFTFLQVKKHTVQEFIQLSKPAEYCLTMAVSTKSLFWLYVSVSYFGQFIESVRFFFWHTVFIRFCLWFRVLTDMRKKSILKFCNRFSLSPASERAFSHKLMASGMRWINERDNGADQALEFRCSSFSFYKMLSVSWSSLSF